MNEQEPNILGFLKYSGQKVADGYLDLKKSGEALIGFDETLRYFLYQEDPTMQDMEFEIPVRIHKGSWEAFIPKDIEILLVKGIITWGVAKYAGSALSEMAKNDFKTAGIKEILIKALKAITWVIRIAIHLGTMTKQKFENVKFSENNRKIGIPNDKGEYLYVPSEYIDYYADCPKIIFSKISSIIEDQRELSIGYIENEQVTETKIQYYHKSIFTKIQDEENEILFPELKHNDYVELLGHVTRGNEKTNSIGFLYFDHILTCYPNNGNISSHKNKLFMNCTIKGYIDRMTNEGIISERKPKIKFIDLVECEPETKRTLFD